MKKKIAIAIAVLVLIIGLGIFLWGGNVWDVEVSIPESQLHSASDLEECVKLVKWNFLKMYPGRRLEKIYYDEDFNRQFGPNEAKVSGGEEAIILYTDWKSKLDDPGNPGGVYTEWKFIFVKFASGSWKLVNVGYA